MKTLLKGLLLATLIVWSFSGMAYAGSIYTDWDPTVEDVYEVIRVSPEDPNYTLGRDLGINFNVQMYAAGTTPDYLAGAGLDSTLNTYVYSITNDAFEPHPGYITTLFAIMFETAGVNVDDSDPTGNTGTFGWVTGDPAYSPMASYQWTGEVDGIQSFSIVLLPTGVPTGTESARFYFQSNRDPGPGTANLINGGVIEGGDITFALGDISGGPSTDPVPEPGTLLLLGGGLLVSGGIRQLRSRKNT